MHEQRGIVQKKIVARLKIAEFLFSVFQIVFAAIATASNWSPASASDSTPLFTSAHYITLEDVAGPDTPKTDQRSQIGFGQQQQQQQCQRMENCAMHCLGRITYPHGDSLSTTATRRTHKLLVTQPRISPN